MTAAEVLDALAARGWTLGVAESLTGGALAADFVAVPGASAVLRGGIVAYATPLKRSLLGVDAALLEEFGPVHAEVALQMAEGIRHAVAVSAQPADVGVATTGIAGPDSPDGQPVGTVHIGVVTPSRSITRAFRFDGTRAQIRRQSVDTAIDVLRTALRE